MLYAKSARFFFYTSKYCWLYTSSCIVSRYHIPYNAHANPKVELRSANIIRYIFVSQSLNTTYHIKYVTPEYFFILNTLLIKSCLDKILLSMLFRGNSGFSSIGFLSLPFSPLPLFLVLVLSLSNPHLFSAFSVDQFCLRPWRGKRGWNWSDITAWKVRKTIVLKHLRCEKDTFCRWLWDWWLEIGNQKNYVKYLKQKPLVIWKYKFPR